MGTPLSIPRLVAAELSLPPARVGAVAELLAGGATIPFMARYRKERTGEMDEVVLRRVQEALERHAALETRRAAVAGSLAERGLLTPELSAELAAAASLAQLEDVYLPYRPRRVTRASRARERGLEPLASVLVGEASVNPARAAAAYVNPGNEVDSVEDALSGARDIIAERISEDRATRSALRELFDRSALIESARSRKMKGDPRADVYRDYFSWSEPASRVASHRMLAMLRGERDEFLVLHVAPPSRAALDILCRLWVGGSRDRAAQMELAVTDSYERLLGPSLETERKKALAAQASEVAAGVFAANLRDLLLAPPLGPRRVLAIDPGLRTGCKVVCLDEHGSLLHHEAIYPLEPHRKVDESARRILDLVARHRVEAIAVGNGTGGRETETFLSRIEGTLPPVMPVQEAGASVYSASDLARAEFPDHDVTVRGAVSIGRRLQDPLAELVKIDPRSIGVGQYQHDLDRTLLEIRLAATVESCVNLVGADLNTASAPLLRFISGITERAARAIVDYRETRGGFRGRAELLKVSGIGDRTFEQAAGFVRVVGGDEPLDATAVHPERYELIRRMAHDADCTVGDLVGNEARVAAIDLSAYVASDLGLPTLRDIAAELARPRRDPRPAFSSFSFSETVHSIDDLETGMQLPGVITNVTNFGAFVDIGVHRDGLVHISRLSRSFVRDPREVVRAGQTVEVTVIDVDRERGRISLGMAE